jgi:hypothetical protein
MEELDERDLGCETQETKINYRKHRRSKIKV